MDTPRDPHAGRRIFPRKRGETTRAAITAFLRARAKHGERPPTQQEIADEVHIAPGTVRYHLKRLSTLGKIRRGPGARGTALEDGAE